MESFNRDFSSARKEIGGEIFQIATNGETSLRDLVEILSAQLISRGVSKPDVRHSNARLGDVRHNYADTSKAKAKLGWWANTSLDVGIGLTLNWFMESKNRGKLD